MTRPKAGRGCCSDGINAAAAADSVDEDVKPSLSSSASLAVATSSEGTPYLVDQRDISSIELYRGEWQPVLELSGVGGSTPPQFMFVQTLIFELKSVLNFNPCAKFQTFRIQSI